MANVINTNISSLNAQRNLSTSQSSLATSLQRLSTGLRINSAKDDAAGQAISTRMTAQINGMQQASRNANDGISMSQTAEGAMGSINDILLRMRDLSVQASNGTNGTAERATIQNEVDQLYQEIDRISGDANFNGIKLLDGSAKSNSFQVGANAGQTISFSIGEVSTKSMKLSGTAAASGDVNSGRINTANIDKDSLLTVNGTKISFTDDDDSAMEVAAAINKQSGTTGVTATANNVVKGTSIGTGVLNGDTSKLTITVQNPDGTMPAQGIDIAASKDMNELVANINKQVAGVTAALDDDGKLTLSNDTGAKIVVKTSDAATATAAGLDAATAGASGATYEGYISLTGANGTKVTVGGDDLNDFGLNGSVGAGNVTGNAKITDATAAAADVGTATVNAQTALNGTGATSTAIDTAADKVKINGVELKQDAFTTAFSAGDKAQAINALTSQTGVTASATTNVYVDTGAAAGTLTVNGYTHTIDDVDTMVTAINDANKEGLSGGISASKDAVSGKLVLTSTSGDDITVAADVGDTETISVSDSATGAAKTVADLSAVAVRGKVTLTSEGGAPIKLEDGNGGDGLAKLGLVEQGGSADPILGGKLDVSTAKGAQDAIGRIDKAIAYVSEQRANMGAVQNRLSTTVSNLSTATENASAARSRIQDADFATETANMTRGQILQQAGTAMLAQANSLPNGVLSLLRG